MSKRKNKGDKRHANKLIPSDYDTMFLCKAVEERFLKVCKEYLQHRGVELVPPPDLNNDMWKWRQMTVRYRQGDYRHTEAEKTALQNISQWTLDVRCRLTGREPVQLEWKD